jgi:hypothetical protein
MIVGEGGTVPVSAELFALRAAVDTFCASPASASGEDLGFELIHLRNACDRLELRFSQSAAAFASTDEYAAWGSATRSTGSVSSAT